jgi:YVTN family beta-propeller protein
VIDAATNTVVATITVGTNPDAVATTPDGKSVYVANFVSNTVSVIATASNTVVATITVGSGPTGVAITPDGKHVYVTTNEGSGTVSVIATASNTVVTTVPVADGALGIGITPDGTQVYVGNQFSTVSVIATSFNTVLGRIAVGGFRGPEEVFATGVGIIPDVPFAAFSPTAMINFGATPNTDAFVLKSSLTLGSTSHGINPLAQPVTFQIGTYAVTIPPGSFTGTSTSSAFGPFFFAGTINGVSLHAAIAPTGTKRFSFQAGSQNASLTGTVNPVTARVSIGLDSGTASFTGHHWERARDCALTAIDHRRRHRHG